MMRIRHTGRRVTMEVSPSALRGVVGGMLLLGFLACRAHADLLTWSNPAGGDFLNAANWTPPKIPGTNDIVVFDLPGPYEVTWSGNATGHSFRVTQGTVTWNLNGKTFGVNRYSTNSVGTVGTTADLTITNGTVIRMNAGYLSSFAYSFKLKGAGTAMRLLAGGKYLDAYYTEYGAGTTLLLDGAGAEYSNGGMYSRECKGTIIVTNGAYLNGYGGWTIQTGADLRFSGAGERGYLAITSMAPGSSLRVDNGAGVKTRTTSNNQTIDGTLTLDDGRLFFYYNAGGSLLLRAPAVLQGRGQVEYKTIEQAGAALRPGGAGGYGTLAILGDLTNSTGTGVMEIEMGGAGAGEYDRLTVAARPPGSAGQATFGGTLKLTLAEGYTPADDDAFDILDFVSCGGPFDAIEFPGGAYWFWNTNDLYTTGVIRYEIPAALPAPAAVAASDAAYLNRIVVDWEPVVGATGYEVWRSLANDSATANLLAAVEESPFTDVTPVPDTTYYYWLKATNAYLVSAFSLSDAGSSLSDLPVPAAPQDVAAGDGDYMQQGRVWITWSAAADAIGYQIWRNASNDLATASLLGASAAPGFADTAVTVGVTNFYWIRGTNELYIGAFSLPDSGWMAPPAPFEIVWSNPAGGDYDDPANWTPGWIPGPTNRAVFSITPEPYTV
ncbi:MAG: hypothetical protein GX590_05010, partial [Lentisphaerae bacterium]|nr:hypothetical protein [Lentisphaerota bacterium]